MKCATCGKRFKAYHKKGRFCSRQCKNDYHNELRRKALAAYLKRRG